MIHKNHSSSGIIITKAVQSEREDKVLKSDKNPEERIRQHRPPQANQRLKWVRHDFVFKTIIF